MHGQHSALPQSLPIILDCDDDKPITMKFDPHVDFNTFRQRILDRLKLTDINRIHFGFSGSDKKLRKITDNNFKSILSASNISLPFGILTTLFIGFHPKIPIIHTITTHKNGQVGTFNIKFKSKLINTLRFHLQSGKNQDIATLDKKMRKDLNIEINIFNPNGKYRVRVKAINKFGESPWSEWSEYFNYDIKHKSNGIEKRSICNKEDRSKIFSQKLYFCKAKCNFLDTSERMMQLIQTKTTMLSQISQSMSRIQDGCFQESLFETCLETISQNLFRSLPYQYRPPEISMFSSKIDEIPQDNHMHFKDAAWPHLQFVYEILWTLVNNKHVTAQVMETHFTVTFLTQLTELFASGDQRERKYLMQILQQIYNKCVAVRTCIVAIINGYLYRMIYSNEFNHFNGILELLHIISSIIVGLDVPINASWHRLARNILVPLHKSHGLIHFWEELNQCCINYAKHADGGGVILSGLLKFWPKSAVQKEELFIMEIVDIINVIMHQNGFSYEKYEAMLTCAVNKLTQCLLSKNDAVVKRAINVWEQGCMDRLVDYNRKAFLPLLCEAFYRNKTHSNPAIKALSCSESVHWGTMDRYLKKKDKQQKRIRKALGNARANNKNPYEIVEERYAKYVAKHKGNAKRKQQILTVDEKLAVREHRWGIIEKMATVAIIERSDYNVHYYIAKMIVSFL